MELWAAIDLLGGRVVTLRQGKPEERTTWKGRPEDVASRWQDEGADGLHVVDLDAAFEKGSNNREETLRIIANARIPIEVGGGIRSVESVKEWIDAGAERVVVGTLAYREPATLVELVGKFGPERIVVAADYKDMSIAVKGWTQSQGLSLFEAVKQLEASGVRNILTTSVGRDGTGNGPDIRTLGRVCASTRMKVLASGGIRNLEDLKEIAKAGAWGAILGKAIYEGTVSLSETKLVMR